MVTTGGFARPGDAVASPDGKTFFFTAYSDQLDDNGERAAAIFKVSSTPGSTAEAIAIGAPLNNPTGLVMSCDGKTLFVADMNANDGAGAIFALPTAGGTLSDMAVTGIDKPSGLAMNKNCKQIHATGRTAEGAPGLFTLSTEGGAASSIYSGDPLISPTGLHVDESNVAWVMDHRAVGAQGEGVLYAITADGGKITEVASNLRMGTPGGVSLLASGRVAVIPVLDADGKGQLLTVDTETGEQTTVASEMSAPAGLRTAKNAGVFAVVDSDGAIYRAE